MSSDLFNSLCEQFGFSAEERSESRSRLDLMLGSALPGWTWSHLVGEVLTFQTVHVPAFTGLQWPLKAELLGEDEAGVGLWVAPVQAPVCRFHRLYIPMANIAFIAIEELTAHEVEKGGAMSRTSTSTDSS